MDDPTSHAAVILIGGAHSESGNVIGMSAAQLWELLTTHAWRTGKVAGTRDYCSARAWSPARVTKHLRHRRALQPAFHPGRIAEYLAHFARAARPTADRWSDGGGFDLVAEMSAMTLDGAGAALFGSDLRAPAPQITHALSDRQTERPRPQFAGYAELAGPSRIIARRRSARAASAATPTSHQVAPAAA